MGESAHYGRNFLNGACGTGQGIEALEAEESIENVDRLVECPGGRLSVLLDETPNDDTQALPPPFVSCPHHLLEVRIECGQRSQSARHEPIRVPEATEDGYVFVQCIERFRSTEGVGQLLHSTVGCKGVAQGFQEPDFGTKLVVDGHAGDVGFAGKTDVGKDLVILAKDRRIKALEEENRKLKQQRKVALGKAYDRL